MKKNKRYRKICAAALAGILLAGSCPLQNAEAAPPSYLKAATYVSDAWVSNFWNTESDHMEEELAQIAAEKIIEMIREEKLQPGDRLQNEYDLAKRLEVGRSTVREAIKSLETRNILTIRRGAGTYLSSREGVAEDPLGIALMGKDEEIALELLEVRMILEPESAAMAAVHASKEEKAAIRRQNRRVTAMIEQGLNHTEEDSKFHQLIAKATGNRIIAKLIPIIYRSVSLTIEMTNRRLSETTILFHEQIVDAIERGDERGARSAMVAHMSENRLYIIKEIERKNRFQ